MTLTEKINQATKKAYFLIDAKKQNLSEKQITVLMKVSHNKITSVNEWASIKVLKRKKLIIDNKNRKYIDSHYKLNY